MFNGKAMRKLSASMLVVGVLLVIGTLLFGARAAFADDAPSADLQAGQSPSMVVQTTHSEQMSSKDLLAQVNGASNLLGSSSSTYKVSLWASAVDGNDIADRIYFNGVPDGTLLDSVGIYERTFNVPGYIDTGARSTKAMWRLTSWEGSDDILHEGKTVHADRVVYALMAKTIDNVEITITAPAAGSSTSDYYSHQTQKPELSVTTSGVRLSDVPGYWVTPTPEDDQPENFAGTFEAGKTYYAYVQLSADMGYYFTDNPTYSISGGTFVGKHRQNGDGAGIYVAVTIPEPIKTATLTVTPPVAGTASTDATSQISVGTDHIGNVSAVWQDHTGVSSQEPETLDFVEGNTYYALVYLYPEDGYSFALGPSHSYDAYTNDYDFAGDVNITGGTVVKSGIYSGSGRLFVLVSVTATAAPPETVDIAVRADPNTDGLMKATYTDASGEENTTSNLSQLDLAVKYNTDVTVTAKANSGKKFTGWYVGDDCVSTDKTYTLKASEAKTVKARFASAASSTLYIGRNVAGGTIKVQTPTNSSGSTVYSSGQFSLYDGNDVTLTAMPSAGYVFVGWYPGMQTGSNWSYVEPPYSTDKVYTFAMGAEDKRICAVFEEAPTVKVTRDSSDYNYQNWSSVSINDASGTQVSVKAGDPVKAVITPQSSNLVTDVAVTGLPDGASYGCSVDDEGVATVTFTMPSNDVEVMATLSESMKIIYDVNGGTKGAGWTDYKKVKKASSYWYTAPSRLDPDSIAPPESSEYTGVTVQYSSGTTSLDPGSFRNFSVMSTQERALVVTYQWAQVHTVTFDTGKAYPVEVESQQVKHGELATRPLTGDVDRYGYNHKYYPIYVGAWYKDEALTDSEMFHFDRDTVTSDMTLHAKWMYSSAPHTWDLSATDSNGDPGDFGGGTVSYDISDGSTHPSWLAPGTQVTITATPAEGHKFVRWVESAFHVEDITGVREAVVEEPSLSTDPVLTYTVAKGCPAYPVAVFEANPFVPFEVTSNNSAEGKVAVQYTTESGTEASVDAAASQAFNAKRNTRVTFTAAAEEGYAFAGWYDFEDGEPGELLSNEKTYTFTADDNAHGKIRAVFAQARSLSIELTCSEREYLNDYATYIDSVTVNGEAWKADAYTGSDPHVFYRGTAAEGATVDVKVNYTAKAMSMTGITKVFGNVTLTQTGDAYSYSGATFTMPGDFVQLRNHFFPVDTVTFDASGGTTGEDWPENNVQKMPTNSIIVNSYNDPKLVTAPGNKTFAGLKITDKNGVHYGLTGSTVEDLDFSDGNGVVKWLWTEAIENVNLVATAPNAGQSAASFSKDAFLATPPGAPYSVSDVTFYTSEPEFDWGEITTTPFTGAFEAGKTYYAYVTVLPADEYHFLQGGGAYPNTKLAVSGAESVYGENLSISNFFDEVTGSSSLGNALLSFTLPKAKYTVSFEANGGSGSMAAVQVDDGADYTLPACTFTAPDGKEFDKWDKGAPGASIKVTADTTVKAQWKDKAAPGPAPGPEPEPVYTNPFTDVHENDYFYKPVLWAANHDPQITTGYTGTTLFGVGDPCLREQVVTFLWRSAGCPEPASTAMPFVDVKAGDYFYKAVLWAVEQGITTGYTDGSNRFGVGDPCLREQVVTFLWRSAGKPAPTATAVPFVDARAGAYYIDAMLWAVEREITTGYTDGSHRFGVGDTCLREQVVTFLYRAR